MVIFLDRAMGPFAAAYGDSGLMIGSQLEEADAIITSVVMVGTIPLAQLHGLNQSRSPAPQIQVPVTPMVLITVTVAVPDPAEFAQLFPPRLVMV